MKIISGLKEALDKSLSFLYSFIHPLLQEGNLFLCFSQTCTDPPITLVAIKLSILPFLCSQNCFLRHVNGAFCNSLTMKKLMRKPNVVKHNGTPRAK